MTVRVLNDELSLAIYGQDYRLPSFSIGAPVFPYRV